jgi:hypothetical protein
MNSTIVERHHPQAAVGEVTLARQVRGRAAFVSQLGRSGEDIAGQFLEEIGCK